MGNIFPIFTRFHVNAQSVSSVRPLIAASTLRSAPTTLFYAEISRLNTELDTLKNEYAIEQAGAVSLTITEVKFFLTQLRKGRADDISYRKTLINVFVNAIYLYDDKLVIFFNSGDKPVTIDDELLDQIENSAGFVFGALGSTISPP